MKAAIAEAELISGENYTEDSYAELTTALTAAKELPEDSEKADIEAAKTALETAVASLGEKTDDSSSESIPDSESTPDSESSSDSDADSSSKTEDESSSKTDDSSNDITSKTDSAGSDSKAGTTGIANNSGASGTSNPNTGAASAAAAGIILLSAIGVIASRKK